MDWAFGPTALDDVWLDDEDCRELREAWESHRFGNTDGRFGESAVNHFVAEELRVRVPRLAAMADSVHDWLLDSVKADEWLPSPQAKADEAAMVLSGVKRPDQSE